MYRNAATRPPLLSSSQTSYRSVSTLPPPFGSLDLSRELIAFIGTIESQREAKRPSFVASEPLSRSPQSAQKRFRQAVETGNVCPSCLLTPSSLKRFLTRSSRTPLTWSLEVTRGHSLLRCDSNGQEAVP